VVSKRVANESILPVQLFAEKTMYGGSKAIIRAHLTGLNPVLTTD